MYIRFREELPNAYKLTKKLQAFLLRAGIDTYTDFIHSYKAVCQASYKTAQNENDQDAGTMVTFEYHREKKDELSLNSVEYYLEAVTKQFVSNIQGDQYALMIDEKITKRSISGELIYEKSCPCQLEGCKGSRQFYMNPVCPYFYA